MGVSVVITVEVSESGVQLTKVELEVEDGVNALDIVPIQLYKLGLKSPHGGERGKGAVKKIFAATTVQF